MAGIEDLAQVKHLYHFTDARNLPVIKEHGGILSSRLLREMKIEFQTGGNQWSIDQDLRTGMDAYVHLCWDLGHPMAYNIRQREGGPQVVYLEIDRSILERDGVMFSRDVANSKPEFPFRDDPLQIIRAHRRKQLGAAAYDVIVVDQPRVYPRHDGSQSPLPFEQRAFSQILAVDREHVERHEVRPVPAEEQAVEHRAAIGRQANDLSIEHARLGTHRVRDFVVQHWKLLVDVPTTRHERALITIDLRERPEAVVFQLENPITVVERAANADQRHRAKLSIHSLSVATTKASRRVV